MIAIWSFSHGRITLEYPGGYHWNGWADKNGINQWAVSNGLCTTVVPRLVRGAKVEGARDDGGIECRTMATKSLHQSIATPVINIWKPIWRKSILAKKLALFSDYWTPKIVGDLNDSYIKLAKFKEEFVWHKHDNEDELFFIIKLDNQVFSNLLIFILHLIAKINDLRGVDVKTVRIHQKA